MRTLFLDDDEERHRLAESRLEGYVTFVRDYDQAILALALEEPFDIAYLDHDLFYRTIDKTGYDVALFIVRMAPSRRPKKIVIHSHNETDRNRMFVLLRDAGCAVLIEPFKL